MTSDISIFTQDRVLVIQFERADKKNAITSAMYNSMTDGLNQLAQQPDLRAALICGHENCFTAGNDLEDFLNNNDGLIGETPVTRFLNALCNAAKPIVAAVNGPAIGIGTTLLLHCDLVYAGPQSKFQMPFVSLGLCPEAGSSYLLPQQLGYRKAAELLLLGQSFDAEEAKEMGFVNRIIDVTEVKTYAMSQAQRLAALPSEAVQTTKSLLRQGNKLALQHTLNEEINSFSQLLEGKAAKEAFTAFFEKRKPNFDAL